MGVIYYLVNDTKKKVLELGKGYWEDVLPCGKANEVLLPENLTKRIGNNIWGFHTPPKELVTKLSRRIRNFAGQNKVYLLADCQDEWYELEKKLKYKTDSISESYNACFNKHNIKVAIEYDKSEIYVEV